MVDPINNMFNSIRNAQAVLHQTVSFPYSDMKYEIAKIIAKEGFAEKVEKKGKGIQKTIEVSLKYQKSAVAEGKNPKTKPAIVGFKRISKPGQRIYVNAKEIRSVREGYGFSVISTSKGIMTNKEARKQKLGGEMICEVW